MKQAIKTSHHRRLRSGLNNQTGEETPMQTQRMLFFSLRKPNKYNKIDIKQLFYQDNKPIFSFNLPFQPHPNSTPNPPQQSTPKLFQFNIRNLISRSAPNVPPQSRQNSPKRQTQKDFRIVSKQKVHPPVAKDNLSKMKQDFQSITQQLGMIANLKQHHPLEIREAIKSRKDRVKIYMNNFMTTRYRGKEEKLREKIEKIEIFPWQKSFETEEDNFMQN